MFGADEIAKQNRDYGLEPVPIMAVSSVLLVITTVFLGLRLYVRTRILRARLASDDIFLILSQLFFMAFASAYIALAWMEIYQGPITAVYNMIETVLVLAATYCFCIVFLKIALAAFYLRFVASPWQRNTILVVIALNTAYYIASLSVTIFQCGLPLPGNFVFPQFCNIPWSTQLPLNYIGGIFNCLTDWLLTVIPIFNIAKLQLNRQDKILACMLVGAGSIASTISIARIFLLPRLRITGDLFFFREIQPLMYISISEVAIGIAATCASSFRPLWSSVAGRSTFRSATVDRTGSSNAADPSASRGTRRRTDVDADLFEPEPVAVVASIAKVDERGQLNFITTKEYDGADIEKTAL